MSQKSSDKFVLNWTEACDRMISQHLSKSVLKRMKMSGNGSKYPKSKNENVQNRTKVSEIRRMCTKTDRGVRNRIELSKLGRNYPKSGVTL